METKRHLTAVKTETPWSDPRSFRQNLYDSLREQAALNASGYREPLLDRIASAFGSERTFFFILGGYVGALLSVAMAFVWALVL